MIRHTLVLAMALLFSPAAAQQITVNPPLGLPSASSGFTCTNAGVCTIASAPLSAITGFGTNVATALGIAVGSAGGPVTNGGALGSPSSAGTLPAHTLGGTVSGGGNQINNVVIGTTSPLAVNGTVGAFSTRVVAGSATALGYPFEVKTGTDQHIIITAKSNLSTGVTIKSPRDADDATLQGIEFQASAYRFNTGGVTTFPDTTDATSTTTGAVNISGGLSVNKRTWMNGLSAASTGLSAACIENTGEVTVNTGVTTCLISAREWKTNIRPLPDSSSVLLALKPRLFDWRDHTSGAPDQIGFIADEVAVADSRLAQRGRVMGQDTWASWHPEVVTTLLVQGYQQHDEKLKRLQADNDNLRAANDNLAMRIQALEARR